MVSMVIFETVNLDRISEFEDWQKRINNTNAKFPGFIGLSSKKLEATQNEYCTVIQFDTPENLKRLLDSIELKELLNEVPQYLIGKPKISHHDGLEIFFSRQNDSVNPPLLQESYSRNYSCLSVNHTGFNLVC